MPRKPLYAFALCCLGSLISAGAVAQEPAHFIGLTSRIPDGANTIVLIDVSRVHNSPIGKAENWIEDHHKQFEAGMTMVPPDAKTFVAAAKVEIGRCSEMVVVCGLALQATKAITN